MTLADEMKIRLEAKVHVWNKLALEQKDGYMVLKDKVDDYIDTRLPMTIYPDQLEKLAFLIETGVHVLAACDEEVAGDILPDHRTERGV